MVSGRLLADPEVGTRIETAMGAWPVMWPHGFTARRVGAEVEVLDLDERVVAVTGRDYSLLGAQGQSVSGRSVWIGCSPSPRKPG